MVEAKQKQSREEEAHSIIKYFWMITDDVYDKLREINGCESLKDLNATQTDGKEIQEIAFKIGVPKENIIINNRSTFKDLKTSYMKIMKLSRAHSAKKEPHFIFVYIGGHGATENEK